MDYNDGPVLVECVVAQEDNVYPMIPSGQTVNEIIDTPEPATASDKRSGSVRILKYGKNTRAYGVN
jgi:hypothetical protein